jgi:ABC-type phosphate/phosphonate transport system substrate-binding protein
MERPILVGAQAVEPNGVTIWGAVRRYFFSRGVPMDYALFSTYEALDRTLVNGAIDVAWNAPLAQAQTIIQSGGACRVLAMRDTDKGVTTVMLVRADSPIQTVVDLRGKRLALGEPDSSELSLIPRHQLRQDGLDIATECTVVELESKEYVAGIRHVELRTIVAALEDGIVDAATLFEPQYRQLVERGRLDGNAFRTVWRSRPYSHCGFAARPGLPEDVSRQFVEILTSMDYNSPEIKEMMDLEHLRAWVPADESGWQDLISEVKTANLEGESWGVTYVVARPAR